MNLINFSKIAITTYVTLRFQNDFTNFILAFLNADISFLVQMTKFIVSLSKVTSQ